MDDFSINKNNLSERQHGFRDEGKREVSGACIFGLPEEL